MNNHYSPTWFELFHSSVPAQQTATEAAFIAHHLPQPTYETILDLCCGYGRHACELATHGYRVTGVDRDAAVVAEAQQRECAAQVTYLAHDMRQIEEIPGTFDAVVNVWQSFGYFDREANADVIRQIARKLRPGGRLILDIYHRAFFGAHQGERVFLKDGVPITERKQMNGERLTVTLTYDIERRSEVFDWQLYTPEEIIALAACHDFTCVVACRDFSSQMSPSAASPRMQFVLQRR
ncbi:MAG: class I SAM-dependent methyltransferase [Chloroflexia bacterium]|nr:class I SAM-dependent methyltransferase [Chloroflexia bacterium]